MAGPVTDFSIDTAEIRTDHFWKLPHDAREIIRTCGLPLPATRDGFMRFEIAAYRWKEIEAAIRQIETNA